MAKPTEVQTIRGRVPVEGSWPSGGMVSREMGDRNYDVQAFTGYPSSTVARGQWDRGVIYRTGTPEIRLPREARMYDPTNPQTWPNRYG